LSVIPVLPVTGIIKAAFGSEKILDSRYPTTNEVVKAGYPSARLRENSGIQSSHTTATTQRVCGFYHAITYPRKGKVVLLDLGTIYWGQVAQEKGYAKTVGKNEIAGYA